MLFKGVEYRNEASPIVDEYFRRKTLADLGYTSGPTSELSSAKADCFISIASEISRQQDEAMKRRSGKKGGRRR